MAEKLIANRQDFVDMANAVRKATGGTESFSFTELKDEFVSSFTGEIRLPELSNPAVASDLRIGKELIGSDKKIVVGAMPDVEIATPTIVIDANGLITAGSEQLEGYVVAGTKSATKQLPTVSGQTILPTKSTQNVAQYGNYVTGNIIVDAIPDEYIVTTDANATPNDILVNASGYVNGVKVEGNILNNGSVSATIDGLETKIVTIPAGYTSGGTVALDSTIDDTADSQAELINEISALLDGKGVSGSSIETCTVTCKNCIVQAATIFDGEKISLTGSYIDNSSHDVVENIIKGSFFMVYASSYPTEWIYTGCEMLISVNNLPQVYFKAIDPYMTIEPILVDIGPA